MHGPRPQSPRPPGVLGRVGSRRARQALHLLACGPPQRPSACTARRASRFPPACHPVRHPPSEHEPRHGSAGPSLCSRSQPCRDGPSPRLRLGSGGTTPPTPCDSRVPHNEEHFLHPIPQLRASLPPPRFSHAAFLEHTPNPCPLPRPKPRPRPRPPHRFRAFAA